MKMKQVLEQTGLTDRAVRLYLEAGLIRPLVAENYNGRKSIDFSDADVLRLRQIALLRQAEFSVSDIHALLTSPQNMPQIVSAHVARMSQSAEKYEKLIGTLQTVRPEDWTLPVLCDAVRNAARETPVPQEDMQPPFPLENEKETARFARRWSIIFFSIAVGALIFSVFFWKHEFYYARLEIRYMLMIWLPLHINWFVLSGLCMALLAMSRNATRFASRRRRANVLTILTVIAVWLGIVGSAVSGFAMPGWLSSETTNPAHYLKVEKQVRQHLSDMDWFASVFPAQIPSEADVGGEMKSLRNGGYPSTTKYYYAYENCFHTNFDIVAQWTLPKKAYDEAKAAVPKAKRIMQKDEWTCFYYLQTEEPEDWDDVRYAYLIFACNDRMRTVRYIAAYAEKALEAPYYCTLDW